MKAKFKISDMKHTETEAQLTAHPVTTGSKENEQFFAATPSGFLQLGVVNLDAVIGLQNGDEIYLTIEKVPAAEAAPADVEG